MPDMTGESRGKGLAPDETERVRQAIKTRLLPKYSGNQSIAGPKIGLDQSSLSRILRGGGTSLETVKALARELGEPVGVLLGWDEAPTAGGRFRDLRGWSEVVARLRETPRGKRYSDAAWERAGNTSGGGVPVLLDDHFVLRLVELWQDAITDTDAIDAERREIDEGIARSEEVARGPSKTTKR